MKKNFSKIMDIINIIFLIYLFFAISFSIVGNVFSYKIADFINENAMYYLVYPFIGFAILSFLTIFDKEPLIRNDTNLSEFDMYFKDFSDFVKYIDNNIHLVKMKRIFYDENVVFYRRSLEVIHFLFVVDYERLIGNEEDIILYMDSILDKYKNHVEGRRLIFSSSVDATFIFYSKNSSEKFKTVVSNVSNISAGRSKFVCGCGYSNSEKKLITENGTYIKEINVLFSINYLDGINKNEISNDVKSDKKIILGALIFFIACILCIRNLINKKEIIDNNRIDFVTVIEKETKESGDYSYFDICNEPLLIEYEEKYANQVYIVKKDNRYYILYMNKSYVDSMKKEFDKCIRVNGVSKKNSKHVMEKGLHFLNTIDSNLLTDDEYSKKIGYVYLDTTEIYGETNGGILVFSLIAGICFIGIVVDSFSILKRKKYLKNNR